MKGKKGEYLTDEQHYEELSQLIKKSYESSSDISLYIQIDELAQWLHSPNTKPLLLTSPSFGGTKTLLCQLLKHLQKTHPKSILISQFASVTPYYSQILYKITMQLRTLLNINQKVQLNQEKLRQYFSYWLQVADQRIEREFLGYLKEEKILFVVLIEGVDKVVDGRGLGVRPAFWLPDLCLRNIKVIYTAEIGSNAAECLLPIISHKIEYVIPNSKIQNIKQKLYKENPKLKNFSPDTHFGDLKIACKILNSHPKFEINQKDITFQEFFNKFIAYASTFVDSSENICRMLGCLIWSKKGISLNTLRRSFRFSVQATERFLQAFKQIIISYNETYLIINRKTRQYLTKLLKQKLTQQENLKKKTHIAIARALKKQNTTLNSLEELIYHLTCSQNYTELKELLSRIENFLVLYTPLTKHLLCMCWFQLEIQFQYDPVFEYNKAIERFLNHYYPSPQDTFKIIFQLSLFFKQYSEFENSKTPQFRHPPIRGEIDQLKEIAIYDELMHMDMYQKCKVKSKETLTESLSKTGKNQREKEKEREGEEKLRESELRVSEGGQLAGQRVEAKEGKEVEKLNVRIKFHQEKFKNLYLEEMEPYVNEFYVLKKKGNASQKDQLLEQDSDDSENQMDETKIDLEKIKKGLLLKRYSDYCEQEYHRSSQKRSFYYYKQWIWMQFPWICQSLNSHYSELIQKCMKSPTEYMSIELESKLISEAVKIARIAKENKKQIYDISSKNSQESTVSLLRPTNSQASQVKDTGRSYFSGKNGLSKYRQKFDISRVDQELAKNAKPKKTAKNESSVFMTDLSMCQSYAQDKQNTAQNTGRFPNITRFSTQAVSRIDKTSDPTDTREYSMLIIKFDELKFENEQLMKRIQTMQFNKDSLKENGKEGQKEMIREEMEQIRQRKAKVMKSYKTQEALRVKLEMIVKLCDINKSHGSESADLSGFLNSLKLMFKIEEQNLEAINQSGKKILEDSKAAYRQIKEEKLVLTAKLKKQRSKFQKSINSTTQNLDKSSIKKHQNKKRKNEPSKQDLKRKHKLDKELDQINSQIKLLNDNFGLVSNQNEKNQQILASFEQKMDKLHQIQWKLNQLMDQNRDKEGVLAQLQERLDVRKGQREHQKQLALRGMQSSLKQNTSKAEERIKCLERCFVLIEEPKQPIGVGN